MKFHVSTVQLSLSLRPAKDRVSRSISVLQEQVQVLNHKGVKSYQVLKGQKKKIKIGEEMEQQNGW